MKKQITVTFNQSRAIYWVTLVVLVMILNPVKGMEDKDLTGCAVEMSDNFFDFSTLTRTNKDQGDYAVTFKGDDGLTTSIHFNLCQHTFRECNDAVPDFANSLNSNNTCNHISQSDISKVKVDLYSKSKKSQIDKDPEIPARGVQIIYNGGNFCRNNVTYQLIVNVKCDEGLKPGQPVITTAEVGNTECQQVVNMDAFEGCPAFHTEELGAWVKKYWILLAVMAIIIGAFMGILGGRFYQITMFLFAQMTITIALAVSIFLIIPFMTPEWTVWLVLLVGLGIGAGVGVAAAWYPRVGVLIIGGWVGALLGFLFFRVVVRPFSEANPILALWLCVAFFGVVVAVLSMIFFDFSVIFGSSLVGSYLFFRGISLFTGGFPSEMLIYQEIRNQYFGTMPWYFFVYLALMGIGFVGFLILQLMMRVGNEKKYSYRRYDFQYKKGRV